AVDPGFRLDQDSAPHIARVSRQLDGIPLALELAAVRVRVLSVAELAERLHDRLGMLTTGARTSDARERTLRATLDWSHQRLEPAEQVLFRRLSVFRGGWTLAAAEEVCAAAGAGPA